MPALRLTRCRWDRTGWIFIGRRSYRAVCDLIADEWPLRLLSRLAGLGDLFDMVGRLRNGRAVQATIGCMALQVLGSIVIQAGVQNYSSDPDIPSLSEMREAQAHDRLIFDEHGPPMVVAQGDITLLTPRQRCFMRGRYVKLGNLTKALIESAQETILTTAEQTEIILYTHPDCPFSAQAKMHYRRQRVPYTEIDVSKQPDQIPALLELSGGERITPIVVENGVVTIGFEGGF